MKIYVFLGEKEMVGLFLTTGDILWMGLVRFGRVFASDVRKRQLLLVVDWDRFCGWGQYNSNYLRWRMERERVLL